MNLEVLAPVGDKEGVKVAINSGANAVYFGLPKFNARAKATNITLENLRDVVKECHLFNVKTYVTINTIVKQSEVNDFLNFVWTAIEAKVDAFIVQDFGMAHLLKNTFKNINLHASTQMGVHNLWGAKILEKMGFSRVVLSRETKLEDIIEIKKNTKLEIEYFVQGALCVAFSGNCYLSSLNNDKSGNRGECAQLCRLKYSAVSDDEQISQGYLLSTTDLCLMKNLKTLVDAGVTSFKIEGRLRRYGYIAESINQYSKALKNLNNIDYSLSENALKKVFNRGNYNNGIYLSENNNRNIINSEFQNHRGVLVGKIKDVKPFKTLYQIVLTSKHKLNTNDGLKFIKDGNEISIGVGNVVELGKNEYKIFSNKKPEINSDVYLTVDSVYEEILSNVKRLIDVNVYVEFDKYQLPFVRLRAGNTEVEVYGDDVLEPAKNAPISVQNVKECFSRVDAFPFNVKTACALGGVFIPKSILNDLRRRCFEELYNKLVCDFERENIKEVKRIEFTPNDLVEENNFSAIVVDKFVKEVNNFDIVVYAPNNYSVNTILEFKNAYKKPFYLELPIILNSKDKLKIEEILKEFKTHEIGFVANNIWALKLTELGYKVIGGYKLNIANNYTVQFLNSFGIKTFIKTVEPSLEFDFEYGLKYNGNVALMTLCHCPYKTAYNYTSCNNCKCDGNLKYFGLNNEYKINRYIVDGCYFELKENKIINSEPKNGVIVDIR